MICASATPTGSGTSTEMATTAGAATADPVWEGEGSDARALTEAGEIVASGLSGGRRRTKLLAE